MKYLLLTVLVIGAALFTRCTHPYKKPPAKFVKEQFGLDLPPHTTLLDDVRTYNDVDLVGYSRIKYRLGEAIDADVFLKANGFEKTEADRIGGPN